VEGADVARARGARVLAHVRQIIEWRSRVELVAELLPPAGPAAEVLLARPNATVDELLAGTSWSRAPRLVCGAALGESDGLGAAALAVAAGRIAVGQASDVLVLGLAPGRGYAMALG
jgi:3-oxoacyl-[acyl-carrier-protein] synthase II